MTRNDQELLSRRFIVIDLGSGGVDVSCASLPQVQARHTPFLVHPERPLGDSLGDDSYESDGNESLSDSDIQDPEDDLVFANRVLGGRRNFDLSPHMPLEMLLSPLSIKKEGSEDCYCPLTPNKRPEFSLIQIRASVDQVMKCTSTLNASNKSRIHRAASMIRRSHPFLLKSDLLHQEWELRISHEDFFFPGPEDEITLVIKNEDEDEEIELEIDLFDGIEGHDHIKGKLKINLDSLSMDISQ